MQICTSPQTDNHASTPPLSFLQARCPSCHPTNSIKALKAIKLLIEHFLQNTYNANANTPLTVVLIFTKNLPLFSQCLPSVNGDNYD